MSNIINKLRVFDTYKREVVEFNAINNNEASLYACGPTVYDYAHIGNLRTYIFSDLLRRALELNNYAVNHVMNITDVGHLVSDGDTGEDKMEKGARKQNKSAWDIALYFEKAFLSDTDKLNIIRPTTICRATDHIQEQIDYILDVEKNGFTYKTTDGIYFDTQKLADNNFEYGQLARLDIKGLQAGSRVEIADKKNVTDFALWKFSNVTDNTLEKRQMQWESPWGTGFPGWHIECSAMSEKYLGKIFDIHVGGEDHIPVHHSNEIAQCQARNGDKPANYWMHGYFLQLNKEKISKSGKSLLLKSIINEGIDPLAYRYLTLTSHYRSQLSFSWDALESASIALKRLKKTISQLPDGGHIVEQYQIEFINKVNNDLNLPQALTVLWALLQSDISDKDKKATAKYFDRILGLSLDVLPKLEEAPQEVISLAELRVEARKSKNWLESDKLREKISKLGYEIKDEKNGYSLIKQ
ncbi:cysteine--tRNA ligase [Pseudoalteromonas denitrificans]|uniref:Cysteine--tRNA ligase n=1 Tax=Pseudoalteromonas denitrificans DSM 6059 TaxID=1123010 RepID=A0A1I1GB16_9GAMM|nr:cysteine--tRNA ligase [Pseudoalteromonas denitrificans]SFC08616.1 cysteinyl-tRNA synthetase [Pseudoalteromonas denitrificans DSM 6059]